MLNRCQFPHTHHPARAKSAQLKHVSFRWTWMRPRPCRAVLPCSRTRLPLMRISSCMPHLQPIFQHCQRTRRSPFPRTASFPAVNSTPQDQSASQHTSSEPVPAEAKRQDPVSTTVQSESARVGADTTLTVHVGPSVSLAESLARAGAVGPSSSGTGGGDPSPNVDRIDDVEDGVVDERASSQQTPIEEEVVSVGISKVGDAAACEVDCAESMPAVGDTPSQQNSAVPSDVSSNPAVNAFNSFLSALKSATNTSAAPVQEVVVPSKPVDSSSLLSPSRQQLTPSDQAPSEPVFSLQNHAQALGVVGRLAVWGGLVLLVVAMVQKMWQTTQQGGAKTTGAEGVAGPPLENPPAKVDARGSQQQSPPTAAETQFGRELEVVMRVPEVSTGWWQTLQKVHYINFGSQFGILPRICIGPRGSQPCLVAFEDAADAEFVAANIMESLALQAGVVPGYSDGTNRKKLKYLVVSCTPLFLEDIAGVQGCKLEVLPQECLRHSIALSPPELEAALKLVLTGQHEPATLTEDTTFMDPSQKSPMPEVSTRSAASATPTPIPTPQALPTTSPSLPTDPTQSPPTPTFPTSATSDPIINKSTTSNTGTSKEASQELEDPEAALQEMFEELKRMSASKDKEASQPTGTKTGEDPLLEMLLEMQRLTAAEQVAKVSSKAAASAAAAETVKSADAAKNNSAELQNAAMTATEGEPKTAMSGEPSRNLSGELSSNSQVATPVEPSAQASRGSREASANVVADGVADDVAVSNASAESEHKWKSETLPQMSRSEAVERSSGEVPAGMRAVETEKFVSEETPERIVSSEGSREENVSTSPPEAASATPSPNLRGSSESKHEPLHSHKAATLHAEISPAEAPHAESPSTASSAHSAAAESVCTSSFARSTVAESASTSSFAGSTAAESASTPSFTPSAELASTSAFAHSTAAAASSAGAGESSPLSFAGTTSESATEPAATAAESAPGATRIHVLEPTSSSPQSTPGESPSRSASPAVDSSSERSTADSGSTVDNSSSFVEQYAGGATENPMIVSAETQEATHTGRNIATAPVAPESRAADLSLQSSDSKLQTSSTSPTDSTASSAGVTSSSTSLTDSTAAPADVTSSSTSPADDATAPAGATSPSTDRTASPAGETSSSATAPVASASSATNTPKLEIVEPEVYEPPAATRVHDVEQNTTTPYVNYDAQPWRSPDHVTTSDDDQPTLAGSAHASHAEMQTSSSQSLEADSVAETERSARSVDGNRQVKIETASSTWHPPVSNQSASTPEARSADNGATQEASAARSAEEDDWAWKPSAHVDERQELQDLKQEVMKLAMQGSPESLKKAFTLMEQVELTEQDVQPYGEALQMRSSLENVLGLKQRTATLSEAEARVESEPAASLAKDSLLKQVKNEESAESVGAGGDSADLKRDASSSIGTSSNVSGGLSNRDSGGVGTRQESSNGVDSSLESRANLQESVTNINKGAMTQEADGQDTSRAFNHMSSSMGSSTASGTSAEATSRSSLQADAGDVQSGEVSGVNIPETATAVVADVAVGAGAGAGAAGGSAPKPRVRKWKSWRKASRSSSGIDSFVKVEENTISSSQTGTSVSPGVNGVSGSEGSDGPSKNAESSGVVREEKDEDGKVEVVSKGAGTKWNKKKPVPKDPKEHFAAINRAMALVQEDANPTEGQERMGGTDEWLDTLGIPGTSKASEPWWRKQFQVLYVPYIAHEEGGMGFVSVNVSLNEDVRDLRIVTFEDPHDAAHCATVLKTFPEYQPLNLAVGQMPTSSVEEDLLNATRAGRRADGLVVYRKGRLMLKVGMTMEDFIQSTVYQAAAQLSLQRTGFDFA